MHCPTFLELSNLVESGVLAHLKKKIPCPFQQEKVIFQDLKCDLPKVISRKCLISLSVYSWNFAIKMASNHWNLTFFQDFEHFSSIFCDFYQNVPIFQAWKNIFFKFCDFPGFPWPTITLWVLYFALRISCIFLLFCNCPILLGP